MNQQRGRGLLVALLSVVFCFVLSVDAFAQYPPPPPQESACAETGVRRSNGKFQPRDEFDPGDKMVARGKSRCAKPKARVRVSIDSDAQIIGSGRAGDKGGYSIGARIPKATTFGTHTIIVRASGFRYTAQIEVVPEEGAQDAGFTGTAGPMLVAWVALAGLIAAFVVGTRRRNRPLPAVAVPGDVVPTFDTSSFVPVLTRGGTKTIRRPKTRPAKPKAKGKSSPSARKRRAAPAKPKAKSSPPDATPVKRKSPAKATPRGPSATTKRSGSKAPRRRNGDAKPKQGRKPSAGGPES